MRSAEIELWSDMSDRRVAVLWRSMRGSHEVVVSEWSMEVDPRRNVGTCYVNGESGESKASAQEGGELQLIWKSPPMMGRWSE